MSPYPRPIPAYSIVSYSPFKRKLGLSMDEETPHIEVRAVHVNDAPALHQLDANFETDRIYTLRVRNHLMQENSAAGENNLAFAFELMETPVDPPIYQDAHEYQNSLEMVEAQLQRIGGGYVALAGGRVAGGVLLHADEDHAVAHIQNLIVGRQFRRYGIGSLLLSCAADWARECHCWAIVLETQNINYPAIQFYLRNGLEIWSINQNYYPPGSIEHEVAIFMGKRLS
jgi:ribosomal protein S18 acetylase RimI-like enzyme